MHTNNNMRGKTCAAPQNSCDPPITRLHSTGCMTLDGSANPRCAASDRRLTNYTNPLEGLFMNKLLATLIAGIFAASATLAIAQTTAQTDADKAKAKAEKEAKFKAQEQSLQKQSDQMPAANVGGSTAKDTKAQDPGKLGKATKEQKAAAYQQMQKEASTSAAQNVGGSTAKTTTASDPGKLGKATKEQKAAYEKSLEKESKGGGGQ